MEAHSVSASTHDLVISVLARMSSRDLYSELKTMWTTQTSLVCYPFPMKFIGLFGGVIYIEMLDGWTIDPSSLHNIVDDHCWCCNRAIEPGALRIEWSIGKGI